MSVTSLFVATACVLASSSVSGSDAPVCPTATPGLRSTTPVSPAVPVSLDWHSAAPFDVVVYWVDFDGVEKPSMTLSAGLKETGSTFVGHVFRVRTFTDELVMEYTVPVQGPYAATVTPCDGLSDQTENLLPPGKAEEFAALVHDQDAPCVGTSNHWSCIRKMSYEEYLARGTEGYGFLENETTPDRVGLQNDASYTQHIPLVPKVGAFGPGFVKMTMPKAIRDVLLPWFAATKNKADPHEPVPGGYLNVDKIAMNRLNLDQYPDIKNTIVREMQLVMQWWTQMRVRHTSTYGVRIYRRGAMLINHVDRGDTHLASAVMQVSQDVDENGGWPLEVLLGNKTVGEVYLQPGEIVLYEGAWLRHGRPMRFKGNEFANIFTHFAPVGWAGVQGSALPPNTNEPLPVRFHGYEPGRCDTIADIAGAPSACTVTPIMDSAAQQMLMSRSMGAGAQTQTHTEL